MARLLRWNAAPLSHRLSHLVALLLSGYVGQSCRESSAAEQLERWRQARASVCVHDFGQLSRYRAANQRLGAPANDEARVVFLGDSITDAWPLSDYFPNKSYINRGIDAQTTTQLLVRLRQDVIELRPRAVVILAGTNDLAGNMGPMSLEQIQSNYATMAELARAHRIAVVLSSVTPVHDYTPESESFFALRPPAKIRALNQWLRRYCAEHGHTYLDYHSAMVDGGGLLRRDLSEDGLHPNARGYELMASLAARALATTLAEASASR